MLLADSVDSFLHFLKHEKKSSAKTYENYDRALNLFLRFAGPITLNNLSTALLTSFTAYLQDMIHPQTGQKIKTNTQNLYLIALRAYLNFLRCRYPQPNLPRSLTLNKTTSAKIHFLTKQELNSLLRAPDITSRTGLRDRAILLLLASTGILVSELVSLNCSHVDFDKQRLTFIGKVNKHKNCLLNEDILNALKLYLSSRSDIYNALFIATRGLPVKNNQEIENRLTARSIERILKKYSHKAKLTTEATPHLLRHTFAAHHLQQGTSLNALQSLLGHAHRSSTKAYQEVNKQALT